MKNLFLLSSFLLLSLTNVNSQNSENSSLITFNNSITELKTNNTLKCVADNQPCPIEYGEYNCSSCCSGNVGYDYCSPETGLCNWFCGNCLPENKPCEKDSDCCYSPCGTNKKCMECYVKNHGCWTDKECCSGSCSWFSFFSCN